MRIHLGFIFFYFMDSATKKEFGKVKIEFQKIYEKLIEADKKADKRSQHVDEKFRQADKRFNRFAQAASDIFATKAEVEYIKENMFTKQDYMDHLGRLEEMISEFKHTRNNNILIGKQLCDLDDTVAGHSKRITVLEDKVLQ